MIDHVFRGKMSKDIAFRKDKHKKVAMPPNPSSSAGIWFGSFKLQLGFNLVPEFPSLAALDAHQRIARESSSWKL